MNNTYYEYQYSGPTLSRWFWKRVLNLGLSLIRLSDRLFELWRKSDDWTTGAFSYAYVRQGWFWSIVQKIMLRVYMLAQYIDSASVWFNNLGSDIFALGYTRSYEDVLDALNLREDEFPSEYMSPRQLVARWQQRISEYSDAPLLLNDSPAASREHPLTR